MPIFLLLILIFMAWFTYERKKNNKHSEDSSKEFWERERAASYVPKQSTADVSYIRIPPEALPEVPNDEEVSSALDSLKEIIATDIADLSGYTNTDLKLKYGTGNFGKLSNADANYTELIKRLNTCSDLLEARGLNEAHYQLLLAAYEAGLRTNSLIYMLSSLADSLNKTDTLDQLLEDCLQSETPNPALTGHLRILLNNKLNS